MDAEGNLYGTTMRGGTGACVEGCGTVFKLTANPDRSWTETVAHSFNDSPDGSYPFGSLTFDHSGNIYGTTESGGAYGQGTVFKLTPNGDGSWSESVLYNFKGVYDGAFPLGGLIFDAAGNLYGTTWAGACCGTVFKLTPNPDGSWTESLLHYFYPFDGRGDGCQPSADLTFDAAGNLYGTAQYYGKYGYGIVFKLEPTASGPWTDRVIHTFKGHPGKAPVGGLVFDKSGNLYGTTSAGGDDDAGIIFKLTPGSGSNWTYNVLHVFRGRDGGAPRGPLILDAAGNLFGTTELGGKLNNYSCQRVPRGCGVVFELTPDSSGHWTVNVLRRLNYFPDGGFPLGGLISDGAGNLFGTTSAPGGVVFEITP